MRARVSSVLLISTAFVACSDPGPKQAHLRPDPISVPDRIPDVADGEDILAAVLANNREEPPHQFRPGHVQPRPLDASAIERTSAGFRVQLPSRAPVVTPTVHRDLVITSGGFHSREVYAFHARTGELAWGIALDDDGPSAAACEDDTCVFNTESCTLFAVDAATGRMRWSHWLGDPLTSAPAIADGIVYTSYPAAGGPSGNTHVIAAFALRTGEWMWGRWIDSDVMSAPVVANGRVYATSFAGTLYELQPRTGRILAAHRTRATSAPIVANGQLAYTRRTDAVGSARAREGIVRQRGNRTIVDVDREAGWLDSRVQRSSAYAAQGSSLDTSNGFGGGAPAAANPQAATDNVGRQSVSTMQAYQGSRMVHHRGSLYSTLGDRIVATDAENGRERWNVPLSGEVARAGGALGAPPALAGGSIFVATLEGEVLQIDPRSGAVRRRHAVGSPLRSQPAIVGGWIYVGTEDGRLVAIDTGDRTLTGWTTWGANAARTGQP